MSLQSECIADVGRLHLLKLARDQPRDLLVEVRTEDRRLVGSVPFPRNLDRVTVEQLDPQETYLVRVRGAGRLGPFRHVEGRFRVRPQLNDLRVLITGSGRCGTQTLAQYLNGQHFADGTRVTARHEPLADWVLDAFLCGDEDFPVLEQMGALHDIESAPYFSIYPEHIRADTVVQVIRDGRKVVQSGLNRGWFTRESRWDYIKPDYGLDQFESSCHLWADCNHAVADRADHVFRLEDLVKGGAALQEFGSVVGLARAATELPHANRGARPASTAAPWTRGQREAFDEICGDLMDTYYPGWRGDESG